jgi:hypothetical protein
MLGAGASMSSGVPTTADIIKQLVGTYAPPSDKTEINDRFDDFWAAAPPEDRRQYLAPYLDKEPSPGYAVIADLIEQDFFDTVVTFNFDRLLEKALERRGIHASAYKVIVRGEHRDDGIAKLLDAEEPRVKILKLHGSLYSADTFLFSKDEMLNYPAEIASVVDKLTARNIIVCGYGFADQCVSRAFSTTGGSIICVNPSVPEALKGFIVRRKSVDLEFRTKFDEFFAGLRDALFRRVEAAPKKVPNPFKFLDSYSESDADKYIGRRKTVQRTLDHVENPAVNMIHILGRRLVGKTSFIRAGVLPRIDENKFKKVYLRCRFGLESSLAEELKRQANILVEAGDAQQVLRRLAASSDKRIVLVLDQFERVILHVQEEDKRKELRKLLTAFQPAGIDRLTVVCVGVDFRTYQGQLLELVREPGLEVLQLTRVDARRVEATIRLQARRAQIQIDRRVIQELIRRYADGKDTDKPFTLAHIQAACHLLCRSQSQDWEAYRKLEANNDLTSLDDAINQYDFVAFIEDFPTSQERLLLLEIMKRVSSQSKWKIAEFLKENCAHLYLQQTAGDP